MPVGISRRPRVSERHRLTCQTGVLVASPWRPEPLGSSGDSNCHHSRSVHSASACCSSGWTTKLSRRGRPSQGRTCASPACSRRLGQPGEPTALNLQAFGWSRTNYMASPCASGRRRRTFRSS
jgi:hypothetical protein